MRNQNIYTSRITWGIEAGSPTNDKPLDLDVGRAFVVFVKNNTGSLRSYRLTIANQPTGGQASFLQFEFLTTLDVNIAPFSTITRPVFISSSDPNASVTINIDEIDTSGNVITGGLKSSILINGDPTNPNVPTDTETHNPNIVNQANPNIVNWYVNPNIVNPNIVNPNIVNPNIVNPNIVNPNIVNPNIVNPNIVNPNIVNPNIVNHDVPNPNIVNPNIVNPNIVNPNIVNAALEDITITDVEWTVKNDGNATTSFTLKALAKKSPPPGVYAQLLVYRVHYTPAVAGAELSSAEGISACELKQEPHHELVLNVVNPNIVNPNIVNPNIVNPNIVNSSIENATFSVGPGEEVIVDLRVLDTGVSLGAGATTFKALSSKPSIQAFSVDDFIDSLGFAVTSQAVNSEDAAQGIQTPPAAATTLVIGTSSLPDGVVGVDYNATLNAYGGTALYNWSFESGELPPGLSLSGGGLISGTPTTAGTYHFIVRVDDSSGQFDTQQYSIIINPTSSPQPLQITTISLPNGVQGYWYGATLEATGGVYPRTWSLASGSLPPGLGLDSGGVISGTPTATDTFSFTVRVTDKNGTTATQLLSITIAAHTTTYYTISGTVYDEQGNPLSGVVTRGLPNTPTTGEDGTYQDKVPAGWSGTVIPFKAGYSFDPPSRTYYPIAENQTGQIYNKPISVYTITVSASPAVGGTVDGGDTYTHGTEVTVTATPAEGYKFVNWTENGNVVSEAASYTFTAEGNRNLVANFTVITIIRYEITVTVSPEGGGTLTGGGTYEHGTEVTVTATPAEGYEFVKWTENETVVSGAASYTFTAESNRNLVANFQLSIPFTAWAKTYGGSASDSAYSIQQTSDGGYIVAGQTSSFGAGGDFWVLKLDGAGDVVWQKTYGGSATDLAYSIQQTSDGGYIVAGQTSSFGAGGYDPWVLKLRPGGSIDPSCPSGMVAESTAIPDSTSVTPSTSTATAKDSAGTITDTAVTPADTSAVVQTQCEGAYETYEITVTASPGEGGTVDGGGTYTHGTEVTVTAAPNKGYEFVNWTEGETVVSEEASYTFTAERNRNLVANFTVITPPDVTPPTVTSFNPADNATGIGATSSLGIIFSENVVKGETGDIVIRNASDASEFETIAVTSSKVTVSDNVVTIDPAGTFGSLTGYFVQIGSTCFKDAAGNYFAGISDATIWNFTSADTVAPTVTSFNPADNATGIGATSSLGIIFSENVVKGETGDIVIRNASDASEFETIAVTSSKVTVSDNVVTIDPAGTFGSLTGYFVQIGSTCFKDAAGNYFAGISDATIWNFTSAEMIYTITASAGAGGSISPSGTVTVNHGSDQTFTITPNTGYHVSDVVVDDLSVGTVTSYTFTEVTSNHTINATFAINTYTISGTVTSGGSGLAGVVMSGLPGNPSTKSSGYYSATVNHGWSGTATPTKAGYTFNPTTRNYTGVSSNFSEQNYTALTVPTQLSPPDGSMFVHYPRTTTLQWSTVTGAASYKVEWQYQYNGTWSTGIFASGITTTSYTFDFVGDQPGRWRVWAVSTNGLEGPKSGWWGFSYITSPPTQISPPDGSVFDFYPRTTTLTWSAVPGAATYKLEIEWYDPGNGSWQPYPIVTGLTTTSYTFNFIGAQPGRWRVCAVSTNGLEGPKSSWWGFSYTQ
jgi:hypothetical protein